MGKNAAQIELAHDLVPLQLVARTIYRRVYDDDREADWVDQRLNDLARAIATTVTVYCYYPERPGLMRELDQDERVVGRFQHGGKMLQFSDGRPPLQNLAVTRQALEQVIGQMNFQDEFEGSISHGKDAEPAVHDRGKANRTTYRRPYRK
jgi:hypothetical protein